MNALGKAIIGIILIIVSLYYIFEGIPTYVLPAWPDVLVVLNGSIPLFVLILGIFIVWLEWDEWKIEKELEKEERKAKRKKKKK